MSIDKYSVGRKSLTGEEDFMLRITRRIKTPFLEHEFHMIMSIVSSAQEGELYEFRPKPWVNDDGYDLTGRDCLPYSGSLHRVIESLVAKNYLMRSSEDPLRIFQNNQLNLF